MSEKAVYHKIVPAVKRCEEARREIEAAYKKLAEAERERLEIMHRELGSSWTHSC